MKKKKITFDMGFFIDSYVKALGSSRFIASGYVNDGSVWNRGNNGNLWSSSLNVGNVDNAWNGNFNVNGNEDVNNDNRYNGFGVRGVAGAREIYARIAVWCGCCKVAAAAFFY